MATRSPTLRWLTSGAVARTTPGLTGQGFLSEDSGRIGGIIPADS